MSETLGKIAKPAAQEFKKGRKLFFVPLVFTPVEPQAEFSKLLGRYWEQAEAHLAMLEEKLTAVGRVFHELVAEGKDEGLKDIERMEVGSYRVVRKRLEKGAELAAIEDRELLNEFMDWGRCLAVGLVSEGAFTTVYNAYAKAQKKRSELMSHRIDELLKSDEAGMLLMREGHQLQFPPDTQVFYVAPPALDEIKRWMREHESAPLKEATNSE